MSNFKKQPNGEYRVFGLNDGARAMCVIPSWMTAETLLAVGADMKPAPVPKKKSPKKKPAVVEDGGF